MNQVRSKLLENYRILYDEFKREFVLSKAWPEREGDSSSTEIYRVSEKALIATLLDLSKGENSE